MALPKIGFIGLGAMGLGVATNLLSHSYPVTGYDLSPGPISTFVSAGGHAAPSPRAAAESADYLCIMVANAAQTSSALFSGAASDAAINGLQKNATIILLSTCAPAYLPQLRAALDAAGRADVALLDCPVSGGTVRAANGTLSIFSAGEPAALDAADAVLRTMAANLYQISGGLGSGTKVKTVHQLLAATNIIAASEALGLAVRAGLNTRAVFEHVKSAAGAGTSFMFENRVPHMLASDWSPLSALGIILKDAGIVTATGREARCATPLVDCAEGLYLKGMQRGLLRADDAKLVTLYLPGDDEEEAAAGLVMRHAETANARMRSNHGVSAETVDDLLAGIHLAASVEAMAFCKALGMERRLMCEIISKAAGWCKMFTEHVPAMLAKDEWTLADCEGAQAVMERLEAAVAKCQALRQPCPMASAALQQFYLAKLG